LLQWASRYAAPRKGSDDQRNLIDGIQLELNGGEQLRIIRPLKFGWEEFDALYQTAAVKFMERRRSMHPEMPSP
jgi:virulence-associated protein VagC